MLKALKNLLGTKSDRDIKAIMPFVKSVQAVYDSISQLSNDELRAKTPEFKERIADYIADEENEIKEIRAQIEANPDMDINEQEKLFKTIDQLKKKSYEKSQEVLNDILPEAFSVVKETAKRFKENEQVEVTATEMDRNMAANRESINIKGEETLKQ